MKTLALVLLALVCNGCAQTRIYEHGQLVATLQGDYTNLTIRTGNGTYFHADAVTHSAATTAAYTGASSAIGAVATGVVAGLRIAP